MKNAFSRIVDFVNIQNYDNYLESSNHAGQYSAFRSSSKEADLDKEFNNLVNSARAWQTRGISKDKIAISIAFYGRYYTLQNPKKHNVYAATVRRESGVLTYSEVC